jgi:hypothetical protein
LHEDGAHQGVVCDTRSGPDVDHVGEPGEVEDLGLVDVQEGEGAQRPGLQGGDGQLGGDELVAGADAPRVSHGDLVADRDV